MLTESTLKDLGINPKWTAPLNECFIRFNISSIQEQAGFIGQCQHESLNFSILSENLNYSAEGLRRVWPKRFTVEQSLLYARNPRMIASKVYADRMGNASEASQDGYKYRGRGLIQLTGKTAYTLCGFVLEVDLVNDPDLLLHDKYAALSAGWYWDNNNLKRFCESKDWKGLTKAINGGYHGLEDRLTKINKALAVLSK